MGQKYPEAGSLTVAANAIAVAIGHNLSLEEQNIVGNLFALAGASLLSMAAINQANQSNTSDSTQSAAADTNAAN
jgi:hypothetical protein